ncbi:MAG: acyl carrier protein [Terriglobales bacterium]
MAKTPAKPARTLPKAEKSASQNGSRKSTAPSGAPARTPAKLAHARAELAGKVLHLIAEEMAVEEAELTPTASFKEDLSLDEIDVAEILMQAELAFGVHPFSEADWEGCATVDDMVQLITRRVEGKRGKRAAARP